MLIDTLLMGDMSLFLNALGHLILPAFVLTPPHAILAHDPLSMLEVLRQTMRTADAGAGSTVVIQHA